MLINNFNVVCADMEFINTRAEFPISGFHCYDLVVSNGKHGGGHGFCNIFSWFLKIALLVRVP